MGLPQPSYAQGFAHSQAEAAYPQSWDKLQALFVPALGHSGNTLLDLSGKRQHGTLQANVTWEMTPEGDSINTTSDGIDLVRPLIWDVTDAFTLVISFVLDTLASNDYIYDQQTNRIVLWNNASGFQTHIRGATKSTALHNLSAGDRVHLVWAVTQSPDYQRMWCNGRQIQNDSTAFTDWADPAGVTKIAERYTGGPNNLPGKISFFACYHRAWDATEAIAFHRDPYLMLRPRNRIFAVTEAPPAPTVKPWWYYQRNAMRRAS